MRVRTIHALSIVLILTWNQLAVADAPARTTELLWPGGAPGSPQGAERREGDIPQLILTRVESEQPTAAVVILPGGGYQTHAIDHEGHQFADWFASIGLTSAICTYRHRGKGNEGKGYGHPYPMLDAQHAIQTLRARSKEWNIDPNRIGVIGSAALGSTSAK